MSGDSKKPSKKHVKREPCSTTTVTSSSTINEILRRYSIYTTQRQRHHGFWGKKTLYPQEETLTTINIFTVGRVWWLKPVIPALSAKTISSTRFQSTVSPGPVLKPLRNLQLSRTEEMERGRSI
nr:uncharacterized protein LOC103247530 isoform X2 [Chlorocebus sabaeus]